MSPTSPKTALLALSLLGGVGCANDRQGSADRAGADSTLAPAPVQSPQWVLTPDHFGPVRIGSSVADLNAILGDSLKPAYQVSGQCDYLRPAAFPAGVSAMIERDTVVRIDVDTTGIETPEGAGVGDTEVGILALFGPKARVTPHKYTGPEGHYVTITTPGDSTRLMIFETDGKVVVRFRAGIRPAVEYVEGCS